jgi:hypothetical protein
MALLNLLPAASSTRTLLSASRSCFEFPFGQKIHLNFADNCRAGDLGGEQEGSGANQNTKGKSKLSNASHIAGFTKIFVKYLSKGLGLLLSPLTPTLHPTLCGATERENDQGVKVRDMIVRRKQCRMRG